MKRTKVLRIIARLNIGGPAIHTVLLSEGLDKSRFETVLLCGTPDTSEGNMVYLAEEKGVYPVVIPELARRLSIPKDFITFCKIFSLIRKEKPDIIHTHTAKAGTLGRLAGLLYKFTYCLCPNTYDLKLIHTFHGHVLHSYFSKVKSKIFVWIERFLANFTDKIIAVSENLRKELISLKIAGPEKIVAVPLGLELDRFLKIENDFPGHRGYKTIGIIGRLVPIKNHKMFLDMAKRLKSIISLGENIKFIIVGDGPLRKELEDYAQSLGLNRDVKFTGWVKDLERVYSEIDVVTLTSLNEGTPVALIEAQAAGRPCVATCVGGVIDVIEDGKSGFLVPSEDIDRFTQALERLLNDSALMKSMGRYGREKVKNRFSKSRLIKDVEDLYKEITDR